MLNAISYQADDVDRKTYKYNEKKSIRITSTNCVA